MSFLNLRDYNAVIRVVEINFINMGHKTDIDEIMEETKFIYKKMRANFINARVSKVLEEVEKRGLPFTCWSPERKVEVLQFGLDDNQYNMQLYIVFCKICNIDTSD